MADKPHRYAVRILWTSAWAIPARRLSPAPWR